MSTITITNEEEFFDFAHSVLTDAEVVNMPLFVGWPKVDLHVQGERYSSSLPTTFMDGLIGFQQELEKAFLNQTTGSSNRQRLTNSDKAALELVFEIEEGSTGAFASAAEALNHLSDMVNNLTSGMTGNQKVISVLAIALAVGGYMSVDTYFAHETAVVNQEQITERQRIVANAQTDALQEQRQAVVDALKVTMDNLPAASHIEEGYTKIVKSVPDATSLTIAGSSLDNEDIQRISSRPDVASERLENTCNFIISSIKKNSDYWLLGVTKLSDDSSFTMKMDTGMHLDREYRAIHKHFEDGTQITLQYQAVTKNGEVTSSRLNNVVLPDTES